MPSPADRARFEHSRRKRLQARMCRELAELTDRQPAIALLLEFAAELDRHARVLASRHAQGTATIYPYTD